MNPSEYVANFFLVIIGFAVSEVLRGSAKLIRERRLIKFYWPMLIVIPLAFEILIFGFMWIFVHVKGNADMGWSLIDVAGAALMIIPWAFLSYLIFPSRIKEGFDMKKFFFDSAKIVIIITMVQTTVVIVYLFWQKNIPGLVFEVGILIFSGLVLVKIEKFLVPLLIVLMVAINFYMFFVSPLRIE